MVLKIELEERKARERESRKLGGEGKMQSRNQLKVQGRRRATKRKWRDKARDRGKDGGKDGGKRRGKSEIQKRRMNGVREGRERECG